MSLRPRMAASLGSSRFLSNLLMLQIHFGFSPRPWRGFTSSLAADSLPISRAAACRASSTGLLCLTPVMSSIAFRGEGNFTFPFDIALASLFA